MLSLINQPGQISLSRNQMLLQFQALDGSSIPYGQQGVRSEVLNIGLDAIQEDETLTVDWIEADGSVGSVTFTAKLSPTDEDHISAALPGTIFSYSQLKAYFDVVAGQIADHHLISPLFDVYAVLGINRASIWIEAKDITAGWSLSWDITDIADVNYSATDYTDVLTTNAPDEYKILLDIFFESTYEGNDFNLVAALDIYIDANSEAWVDLSDIISAAIEDTLPELPIPAFTANQPFKADIIRRFYFRYRESYTGSTEGWIASTVKMAICGGISQPLFASTDFFSSLNNLNSLLSWYPLSKTVSTDQPEWIAWYNYTGSEIEIAIQRQQFTADSIIPTTDYLFSGSSLNIAANEIVMIPVGPQQLNIATGTLKYNIRVVDQANTDSILSQKKSYYVDRQQYRSSKYVVYLNSFCVPETLRCVGVFEKDLDVDRQERRKILQPAYAESALEVRQYAQSFDNTFTYRSGYLSKKEVDALQELLIYNKLYELSSAGYIPLHLTDNKYSIADTGSILSSIQFRAIRAQRLLQYSLEAALFYPGEVEVIITGCDITIAGTYANEAAAITGGLVADEEFAISTSGAADLGVAAGIIFRVQPTYEFSDHTAAYLGGVADDACYAVSQENIFGIPKHIVIKRNPAVTYLDDNAASLGGVVLNEVYALAAGNVWQMPAGTMKKRFLVI